MFSRVIATLIALGAATPTLPQDRMTGAEFDAYVTGRTITFSTFDNPTYGIERYLAGRRVMWSTFDGTCIYGVWYESKGDICFRYDHKEEPQCWAITLGPAGLIGQFTNRPDGTIIYEQRDRDDPLICNDLSS
jgi:hypothetical protein